MKISKRSIMHLVCIAINIPIIASATIASFYPSLFGLSDPTSPEMEFAINVALYVCSTVSSVMSAISLIDLCSRQRAEIVANNSPTQCSEVVDQPPSYSEAIKMGTPNFGSRTC